MSKVFDGMMEAFKELGAIEGYSEDFFDLIDECIEENKEESLNENAVSSKIPEAIDQFLQDIAQMYNTIEYSDIMNHDYTSEDLQKLAKLRGKFRREITYADSGDEDAAAVCEMIARKVAEILKRVDESNNNCNEKDDNKMNEDMSIRAKLKALYPELNFGDDVTEGFDDDMDFDIDESHETRLMDSLYEGSDDFDEYDDEEDDEFSDCEDDECIDDEDVEYDDEDVEWWNDTLDDETGDFIYQAADQLGLEDFWFEDGGYEGAHTPTEFGYTKDGINYKAECDYEDTDVHSVPSAVKLLKNLDWRAE